MDKKLLTKMIDHTILKPDAQEAEVVQIINEAKQYGFASVCINPGNVKLAAHMLKGTDVKVCTVIGFPLGANTTSVKAFEANEAIENGAEEVDMPGFVFEILNESNQDFLKEIESINDSMSLSEKQLEIVKIIRDKYLSTYSDAIRAIVPSCILNENMNAYLDKSPWTITASFIVTFISGGLIAIGAMSDR